MALGDTQDGMWPMGGRRTLRLRDRPFLTECAPACVLNADG